MEYLGWFFVGLLIGGGLAYWLLTQALTAGNGLRRGKRSAAPSVASLLKAHLHPVATSDITVAERKFPFRVRADIQRTIDKLFGDGIKVHHFFGVRKEYHHGGTTISDCIIESEQNPVVSVPPEYEERDTHLQQASFRNANMRGVHFEGNTTLIGGDFENADLSHCYLMRTAIEGANLKGTSLQFAVVDGGTRILSCEFDNRTDFTGAGLANARIYPSDRARLEYNIRRLHWEARYAKSILSRCWQPFWWLSDYGRSTGRLAFVFLFLAVVFAMIYLVPSWIPNLSPFVQNLQYVDGEPITGLLLMCRSFYFSMVTMTTLGFGDMHANPWSIPGHVLLTLQVLIGYVLLGALITRLGILFQSVPES